MTRKNSRNERRSLPAIATLVLLATVFVAFGHASPLVAASQIDPHTSVQQAESQGAPSGGPEALHLIVDRSLVVTSPVQITRVSLANPDICDAVVVSPTEILLNGTVRQYHGIGPKIYYSIHSSFFVKLYFNRQFL